MPSATRMSWTEIRILSPDLRALPSRIAATPSFRPNRGALRRDSPRSNEEVPGHDPKSIDPHQRLDHLLHQPLTEEVLFRIGRHVGEGPHRDRSPDRRPDRGREAVAAAGNRDDVLRLPSQAWPRIFRQHRQVVREVALGDVGVGPHHRPSTRPCGPDGRGSRPAPSASERSSAALATIRPRRSNRRSAASRRNGPKA